MDGLVFPTFAMTDGMLEDSGAMQVEGNDFVFDFETGEFIVSPSGETYATPSQDMTWAQWANVTLRTERYARYAYSPNFGVEIEPARQAGDDGRMESIVRRTVTEAFMQHPWTDSVRAFTFEREGQILRVSCVAVNRRGGTAYIATDLSA